MSSMLDAIGAGGGPPGPGGGVPPLLHRTNAPPPPVPDIGGGGDAPDVPGHPDDVYDTSMQALDVAEHALQAFMRLDHDAQDKAQAAKALTIVSGLKGGHAADAQKGGGKSLIRALAGAPGLPGLGG